MSDLTNEKLEVRSICECIEKALRSNDRVLLDHHESLVEIKKDIKNLILKLD